MVFVCFASMAQTSKPIVQIKDMGGSIRFTHNNGTFTEIPKSSIGAILTFPASTSIQITVLSEGSVDRILGINYTQLTSPIFSSVNQLIDTISGYIKTTGGGTSIPIPLIVNNVGIDSVRVLDSVRVYFNPQVSDTAVIRRMDTIIDRLTPKLDTSKGLVYTAIAKVRTNRDTLYNCKSISFGRKSNASGTLVLTYENGESESFDVANDDLPTWVNGSFISYLDYNATGAVGLIVNTLGCSQTDAEICAKIKPIFDCELVIPIGCLGWQSASGVWQSASGCWNTGQ